MSRFASFVVVAVVVLAACSAPTGVLPQEGEVGLSVGVGRTFVAQLSGAAEFPPVDTRAGGQATFTLSADGSALTYRIVVHRIEDVTMAHVHLAPAGSNGPVVAWLYPDGPPANLLPGRTDGVLATGVLTTDRLVGPLVGQPLDALLEAMASGGAYVNVHTSAFPAGEVRGQVR